MNPPKKIDSTLHGIGGIGELIPSILFSKIQYFDAIDEKDAFLSPKQAHENTHSIQVTSTPFLHSFGSQYALFMYLLISWFHGQAKKEKSNQSIPIQIPLLQWAE